QGELARTIVSLDNVKQARVHLVIPESSLFKHDRADASAAVALTLKPGPSLTPQQIAGIQRLVAASVAGLGARHVVISGPPGITLSMNDASGGNAGAVEARLGVQRQIENYIAQKIAHMLDGALGAGQAIVSVNVAMSFDAIKTTTQDLLPLRGPGSTENAVVR